MSPSEVAWAIYHIMLRESGHKTANMFDFFGSLCCAFNFQAILLALGLQHKTVNDVEKQLDLPATQILGLFNRTIRKVSQVCLCTKCTFYKYIIVLILERHILKYLHTHNLVDIQMYFCTVSAKHKGSRYWTRHDNAARYQYGTRQHVYGAGIG